MCERERQTHTHTHTHKRLQMTTIPGREVISFSEPTGSRRRLVSLHSVSVLSRRRAQRHSILLTALSSVPRTWHIVGAQELFPKLGVQGLCLWRGAERKHQNHGQGQLTTGLKHSDFVHLGLGHVEHQLMLGEEVPGCLCAQSHQGHVLQVWDEKAWPETQA